jgi:hypothetical protein
MCLENWGECSKISLDLSFIHTISETNNYWTLLFWLYCYYVFLNIIFCLFLLTFVFKRKVCKNRMSLWLHRKSIILSNFFIFNRALSFFHRKLQKSWTDSSLKIFRGFFHFLQQPSIFICGGFWWLLSLRSWFDRKKESNVGKFDCLCTVVLRVGRCFLKLLEVRMHFSRILMEDMVWLKFLNILYTQKVASSNLVRKLSWRVINNFFYSQTIDMMKTGTTLKKILEVDHPKTTFRKSHEETINYLPISHSSRS